MKFIDREIKLKNDKIVRIREAKISDAENLFKTIKSIIRDSKYIPKQENEMKTGDQWNAWINSFLENDNSILLVAEYENKIIGNIDLTGSPRKIMQHTAAVGMGMLQEWRNTGLGTALLNSIIEWSIENKILEMIWLQVYTEHTLGINLYKKMGFKENGIIKNFFKRDGNYYDKLTMTLEVKGQR